MNKTWSMLVFTFIFGVSGFAYDPHEPSPMLAHKPIPQLEGLKVDEKLAGQLNLDRTFVNESGETKRLGDYFDGKRPVLLAMVYYSCPSLCNYHLNGLVDTFKQIPGSLGKEFQFVAVSMNHREDADLAQAKKETYLEALGDADAAKHWHFLTGTEENVLGLANELGFKFRWDEAGQQYAHPAVAYVVTPEGVISRYLYGIEISSKTLRLSLIEAAQGKIGNLIDHIILFCFQFNPAKSKYVLYAYNLMQIGAALTVLFLSIFLVPTWWREKRARSVVS